MLILFIILLIAVTAFASFNPRVSIYSQSRVKTNKKVIALTFDDGPSDPYTQQVLDILKREQIHATFFVVGANVRRNPELAKQIVTNGNVIANHSDNHDIKLMLEQPSRIVGNVTSAQMAIKNATGKEPSFFRPSYGFRTWWGSRALHTKGFQVVTWDNMTYDYWGLSPDKIVHNIVTQARPGGIIVLHDGREAEFENVNRGNVVTALPILINRLKAEGYSFVTLDTLFGIPAYHN